MFLIDQQIVVFRPKKGLLGWINKLPAQKATPLSLAQIRERSISMLVPEFETEDELESFLDERRDVILAALFSQWCEEPQDWPDFSEEVYSHWFDVELLDTVFATSGIVETSDEIDDVDDEEELEKPKRPITLQ